MVHRIIQTMRALAVWLLSGTEKHPQPTIRLPRPKQNKDSTSDCLDARETAMPLPKPQPQVVRPSDITSKAHSDDTELPSSKPMDNSEHQEHSLDYVDLHETSVKQSPDNKPTPQTSDADSENNQASTETGLLPSESNGLKLGTSNSTAAIREEPKKEMTPTQQPAEVSQVTSYKAIEQQEDAQHIEPSLPAKDKEVSKSLKKPREIGGRRKAREQKTITRHAPKPRPELICREDASSWQWEVILHVDDECQIKVVYQDGVVLDKFNYEYRVLSLSSPLRIAFESGEEEELPLFDGTPLIFKLRSGWKENGRKTSNIGKGHFVVFAPSKWERTGHVPVEARFCTDKAFKANYFFGENNYSEEDIGGFSQCALPTKSIFELTGQCVYDDSDSGELFVGDPPRLKSSQDIAWVRIGEEKKGGWKGENFNPSEQSIADILGNREGHFFIRVYDNKPRHLDSGEFRYLHDLKEVLVNGQPYDKNMLLVPPSTGYPTINVSFISKNNTTLHPVLMHDTQHTKMQENNLIVEAHPNGDSISCKLESNTGSVALKLNLPRVWWKITSGKPDKWHDTPLAMTRQEFRKHANINSTIELRLPRQIRSVGVGFNDDLERKYPRSIEQDGVRFRMKDFSDYSQIDQRLMEDTMFNINCGKEVLTLIRISADPVPAITSFTCKPSVVYVGEQATLHWVTKNAEDGGVVINPEIGTVESSGSLEISPAKTTTYKLILASSDMKDITKTTTVEVLPMWEQRNKLVAVVRKTNGDWQQGKGFSVGEIRDAGLAISEATRHLIRVDKRRRTTHPNNTQTIRRLVDAKRKHHTGLG